MKAATYEIKWIEDLVRNLWNPVKVIYDKHAYLGTSHWGPKRQRFYRFTSNMTSSKDVYSRRRIIAATRVKIMKMYDYGHLEEIEVRRDDQQLYTFREDERYDLNVALRMFTKRIVIQKRVEDLQLGIESYQKKVNLTKPDSYRSDLRNRTTYSSYSDPHGIALHDISSGIIMEYLPKKKWSNLDKRRGWVMVQDIDKQLFERQPMRNLEKFVGGRVYGNDLRLLEQII
ncbi:hypothetical protein Tco_0983771 [Tanacetum coccineum]